MSEKLLQHLQKMHELIVRKSTGTPEELADKLRISRSCVYKYIGILKKQGASVKYCQKIKSFSYVTNGHFSFRFFKEDKGDFDEGET